MHYLPTAVLRRGVAQVAQLLGGVAFLPTFTADDEIEGDRAHFQRRHAATYRRIFRQVGLIPIGMYAWTPRARQPEFADLELG
jgi:hypothetical protein